MDGKLLAGLGGHKKIEGKGENGFDTKEQGGDKDVDPSKRGSRIRSSLGGGLRRRRKSRRRHAIFWSNKVDNRIQKGRGRGGGGIRQK